MPSRFAYMSMPSKVALAYSKQHTHITALVEASWQPGTPITEKEHWPMSDRIETE